MEKANTKKSLTSTYIDFKKKYEDTLLIFREDGNYKLLHADAVKASKVLGIELGTFKEHRDIWWQLTFSHYDLDKHLPKLIKSGLRVAICDPISTTSK